MIRTQRFTTDSGCPNAAAGDVCVFLEQWDDTLDPVVRTHDFLQREKACSWHAGLSDAAAYAQVYLLNRRKNTTFLAAQQVKSALLMEQFQWSFNADGVLTVNLAANFTNQQKSQLQSIADVQFGPGRVVIV